MSFSDAEMDRGVMEWRRRRKRLLGVVHSRVVGESTLLICKQGQKGERGGETGTDSGIIRDRQKHINSMYCTSNGRRKPNQTVEVLTR